MQAQRVSPGWRKASCIVCSSEWEEQRLEERGAFVNFETMIWPSNISMLTATIWSPGIALNTMCSPQGAIWTAGSASGAWVAWGQLYIDEGEEQELEERGEFVNFRAEVQPSGNGMLTGTFSSTGISHRKEVALRFRQSDTT